MYSIFRPKPEYTSDHRLERFSGPNGRSSTPFSVLKQSTRPTVESNVIVGEIHFRRLERTDVIRHLPISDY